MKLCITANEKSLESALDPRFGRAAFFIIYNLEDDSFQAFDNSGINASGGAGVKAGQFIIDRGVDILITGDVGPNAAEVIKKAGIKVVTQDAGIVSGIVQKIKNNTIEVV